MFAAADLFRGPATKFDLSFKAKLPASLLCQIADFDGLRIRSDFRNRSAQAVMGET